MITASADRRHRFERLASEIHDPLTRYVRRRISGPDADDVVAEVLLTIWRKLESVPEDAMPWTYGVARRALANQRRKNERHLRLVHRLQTEPHPVSVPLRAAEYDDPDLEEALERLTKSERELIRLWAWEGLEARDIAVVLGIKPNAAAIRLSRVRSKLGHLLGRKDQPGAVHEHTEDAKESA